MEWRGAVLACFFSQLIAHRCKRKKRRRCFRPWRRCLWVWKRSWRWDASNWVGRRDKQSKANQKGKKNGQNQSKYPQKCRRTGLIHRHFGTTAFVDKWGGDERFAEAVPLGFPNDRGGTPFFLSITIKNHYFKRIPLNSPKLPLETRELCVFNSNLIQIFDDKLFVFLLQFRQHLSGMHFPFQHFGGWFAQHKHRN